MKHSCSSLQIEIGSTGFVCIYLPVSYRAYKTKHASTRSVLLCQRWISSLIFISTTVSGLWRFFHQNSQNSKAQSKTKTWKLSVKRCHRLKWQDGITAGLMSGSCEKESSGWSTMVAAPTLVLAFLWTHSMTLGTVASCSKSGCHFGGRTPSDSYSELWYRCLS